MALQFAVHNTMKIKQYTGALDNTQATNTYNTGITWTDYAFVSFELSGSSLVTFDVPEISLNKDGTLKIIKPSATWGGSLPFKITVWYS